VSPDPASAVVHRLPSSLGGSSALPWCHGSVLLSYLAAALIFGSGSLAAWKWNAADPVRASGLRSVAALPAMATTAGRTIVGRVTRTADCRLANANLVRIGEAVALGRKFSLVSGTLEIAYASGPTVTLQGPATFEVDSPTGGFLHVGRLSFRVGVNSGQDRPAFCVHTPHRSNPKAPHSIVSKDIDFVVTVDPSGEVHAQTPTLARITALSGSRPMNEVALPDIPSAVIGVGENRASVAIWQSKPAPEVAGKKPRAGSGYVQKSHEPRKGEEGVPADRSKS
jgi:hypothetical protein